MVSIVTYAYFKQYTSTSSFEIGRLPDEGLYAYVLKSLSTFDLILVILFNAFARDEP